MVFTGTYERSLDDKQRLAIPKPLRDGLLCDHPLYLTPGLDGCMAIYPEHAFTALTDRLAASSPAAREVRDYSRLFYSQVARVTLDSQWRFRLPADLATRASLAGPVVVVGVCDHLEVWASEKWREYIGRRDLNYDQLAEQALASHLPPDLNRFTSSRPAPKNQPIDLPGQPR